MLCPRCHTENHEGRRFCSKCAAPLAVVCASCGFTKPKQQASAVDQPDAYYESSWWRAGPARAPGGDDVT